MLGEQGKMGFKDLRSSLSLGVGTVYYHLDMLSDLTVYVPPLFSKQLLIALVVVLSATAIVIYVARWKRKTPVNMVGVGTTG